MCNKFFHIDYILRFNDLYGFEYRLKIRRKKMVIVPPIGMAITFGKFTAIIESVSAPISFDVVTCNLSFLLPQKVEDIDEMRKMGWIVEEMKRRGIGE